MKKLYFSLLFILLLCLPFSKAKAQWVAIPDTNFVNWLNNNGYATCMNGNLMDTTCNAITSAYSVNCSSSNINNLDGIQYFDSLRNLTCLGNNLSSFPNLPVKMINFDCSQNQITALINLPATLQGLYCSGNLLTNLPTLTSTLLQLNCAGNLLNQLPALPASLQYLSCGGNPIHNLPALPNQLTELYCSADSLTSLPSLPNSIQYLHCEFNLLTSLPNLPSSLISLNCQSNQLANLPALPNSIQNLFCPSNQLYALPGLPGSLKYLNCTNNHLSQIPTLPLSLYSLNCYANQITSLPTLNDSLKELYCSVNQLTNLPSISNSLHTIDCSENFITALPPLPNTLYSLNCNDNYLTTLPELPDSLYSLSINYNYGLHCLPSIKRIVNFYFGNSITCLPNYGDVTNSFPPLSSVPLCDLFNTNGCTAYWNISGKVYSDSNNNCVYDASEIKLRNIKLKLDSAGNLMQQTYTGGEGFYSFDTDTGTYTYSVDTTNLPVLVTCPASGFQTSVLTAIDSMDYNMDFGMQCKPGFDVGAFSVARDSGRFRPANFARVKISTGDISNFYGLQCAAGISGIVKIILNGNAAFISASAGSQIPTVNGDTLIYSIADYGAINANTNFSIIVQTDTSAQAGDAICFDVEVTPTVGDNNISNNTLQHCFAVVNSFDPNIKEVFPEGNIDTTQQWLTYTVQFQNTGTAPAQHIYILDTLSASLDESTFTLLAYSHQPLTQVLGNVVRYNFPNINLPDSTNDEPHSHGYVQYKIKLKNNLPIGTVIQNTANIIFDFNTPITTNTTQNTITVPTGTSPLSGGEGQGVRLFPNPVTTSILKINFQSPHNYPLQVVLYDITGRKVFSEKINSSATTQTISLPKLANGIYTCDLTSEDFKASKKLVVMNR